MKPQLKLFNTRTRSIEVFESLHPAKVGLYTCGPTVYGYAHIGNMRTYLFADLLRRTLERFGYDVNHVMNITDVGHLTDDADDGEDKLELGAKREGLDAWAVAQKYTDAFFSHSKKLNILAPKIVCKATDHIADQIEMVEQLEKKGYTYKTADGVYFDTSKFPRYGEFARIDVEGLEEGHRVQAGEKRHKTDFALWKFSKPEDRRAMEWDSPWGRGFPGWHIECSAMSKHYLGEQFDIHTGGVDHIPIHHTNEIAQSECATGKTPFAKYWLHGEFLVVDDSPKMSKSLGNVKTVDSFEEQCVNPMAYRYLCLQSHYRKQLKYTEENMTAAIRAYDRLQQHCLKLREEAKVGLASERTKPYLDQFDLAIAQDLNAPQGIAVLFKALDDKVLSTAEKLHLIESFEEVLGLDIFCERSFARDIPQDMLDLLEKRNAARASKDWAESDRLRDAIATGGYDICDSPLGTTLKKKL